MYKLLLVSDQEDVLEAFARVTNWGFNGFNSPHIRYDLEGAKDSFSKHHADAIILAVRPEKEEELLSFLQEKYPMLPICEAGKTPGEVLEYLGELRQLLNQLNADFSSDTFNERQMMLRCRRYLFRSLVSGRKVTCKTLYREMRLLRSRMDPDLPCILVDVQQAALEEDRLVGRWQDSDHLLEKELYQSFGGDLEGFHVLPLVTDEGKIYVLAGALRDQKQTEDMVAILNQRMEDGIRHAEEFRGLHLRVMGIQVLRSMFAFCSDYTGARYVARKDQPGMGLN